MQTMSQEEREEALEHAPTRSGGYSQVMRATMPQEPVRYGGITAVQRICHRLPRHSGVITRQQTADVAATHNKSDGSIVRSQQHENMICRARQ